MYALITGAAGGLGRAFAAECASRGYDLMLTDVNAPGLEAVRQGLVRQYGVTVHALRCDSTSQADVESLMDYARREYISLDLLLNVAGLDFEGGFLTRSFEHIARILRVNIEATLRVTHRALKLRRKGFPFYIVFVSSLASMYPMPLKATYAASKRFLLDFSIALGRELKDQNVSVLALCPAGLPTKEDCIRAIEAQGFWGGVTTVSVEKVARRTVTKALRGQSVYIPGFVNQIFSVTGRLLPPVAIAHFLLRRWRHAQKKWLTVPG